jgi:hypothetical protein
MTTPRRIEATVRRVPTVEGAGVRLQRVFGAADPRFDPFLLLDDFGSDDPADYLAGFPWHPHRGMETVTYVLAGEVEHTDSLGNRGVIRSGDVQWMSAGSGIIHQEMPQRFDGFMRALQLWVNLPAAEKMSPPRYREVPAMAIPEAIPAAGVRVQVIAGEVAGFRGPVTDVVAEPELLDVWLAPGAELEHPVPDGHTVLAYVLEGGGFLDAERGRPLRAGELAVLADGDAVRAAAEEQPLRFLLMAGRPLGEPVAWQGPIVMSTRAELETAFRELSAGTFIKHPGQAGQGR